MPMYYYKTYKVPTWFHVEEGDKTDTVVKSLEKFGARFQEWPAKNFKETLLAFSGKGWKHAFENIDNFVVPPELLTLAVNEHTKKYLGITSRFDLSKPIHRIDRRVRTDKDYERIFTEVLNMQDPIVLSQSFRVAELCHDEDNKKRTTAWITSGDISTQIAARISDTIVTIGEGNGFDIDVTEATKKGMKKFLETKLEVILNNN